MDASREADSDAGPALVLVPINRADPHADRTGVALRRLPDGRLALPVFSDLNALIAGCGDAQPWMLLPTDRLAALHAALGFDGVVLDARWSTPADLADADDLR